MTAVVIRTSDLKVVCLDCLGQLACAECGGCPNCATRSDPYCGLCGTPYAMPYDEDLEYRGPSCSVCGGNDEDGYENCEYGCDPVYVPGPGGPDEYGCPRMTGTF